VSSLMKSREIMFENIGFSEFPLKALTMP
jgi:hypothetical protein